jgi:hypothetical protein
MCTIDLPLPIKAPQVHRPGALVWIGALISTAASPVSL